MLIYDNINFDTLPLWLSFILCLAITAGGLLVLFRFRQNRINSNFHYLQIFLILLYVYGYYSLWSGVLLSSSIEMENIERVISLVAQLGAPFFTVSLAMLLLWAAHIQKRPVAPLLISTVCVSLAAILVFVQWETPGQDSMRRAASIIAITSSLVVCVVLSTGRQKIVKHGQPLLISLAAAAGLIHLSTFTDLITYPHYDSVFLFFFYLFNTAMVIVYTYQASDDLMQPQLTLEDFLTRYGISKREADIMRGIYAGKTNQEIANQLFISLQTVKDHSSRIYQKTFVKNRAQLTRLIRESQGLGGGSGSAQVSSSA